ncbi:MAG TPA: putative quinol monooxygenase [Paenisporosarcina sp.]|nr:putative quinol monooxygenase [Paenisporosarcina sp.]
MIVIRFKVTSKPDKTEELRAALEAVVAPSRKIEGVISFDVAQDLTDTNTFIATEVFENRAALDRQEAQQEVKKVLELLPIVIAAEPEATIYNVASSEPWG